MIELQGILVFINVILVMLLVFISRFGAVPPWYRWSWRFSVAASMSMCLISMNMDEFVFSCISVAISSVLLFIFGRVSVFRDWTLGLSPEERDKYQ
jgi:hypothetical protein